MKRVSFHTLGCRLNQADSAQMAGDLVSHGYTVVPWGEPAEVLVINSCAVTGVASRKSRQAVAFARKRHPESFLVVCGCAASDPQLLSGRGACMADLLVPNPKPRSLAALLPSDPRHGEHGSLEPMASEPQCQGFTLPGVGVHGERNRANLKVQDGCSFRCTYCIVPQVRGPACSRLWSDVLREARALVEQGFRELVLTGVNIATYSQPEGDLADLLEAILKIPGEFRVRLGSVEPGPRMDRVIDLMAADSRLCRFLHLPLQYGEADILRRMARRYTLEEYARTVESAWNKVPGICLGTDVMVGFPGEDAQAFQSCREYLRNLPLSLLHVFCYSPRPGTPAATWPNRPAAAVAHARASALLALAREKAAAFAAAQVGKILPVLPEEGGATPHGWSDNYLKILLPGLPASTDINRILPCRVGAVVPGGDREVMGTLAEMETPAE